MFFHRERLAPIEDERAHEFAAAVAKEVGRRLHSVVQECETFVHREVTHEIRKHSYQDRAFDADAGLPRSRKLSLRGVAQRMSPQPVQPETHRACTAPTEHPAHLPLETRTSICRSNPPLPTGDLVLECSESLPNVPEPKDKNTPRQSIEVETLPTLAEVSDAPLGRRSGPASSHASAPKPKVGWHGLVEDLTEQPTTLGTSEVNVMAEGPPRQPAEVTDTSLRGSPSIVSTQRSLQHTMLRSSKLPAQKRATMSDLEQEIAKGTCIRGITELMSDNVSMTDSQETSQDDEHLRMDGAILSMKALKGACTQLALREKATTIWGPDPIPRRLLIWLCSGGVLPASSRQGLLAISNQIIMGLFLVSGVLVHVLEGLDYFGNSKSSLHRQNNIQASIFGLILFLVLHSEQRSKTVLSRSGVLLGYAERHGFTGSMAKMAQRQWYFYLAVLLASCLLHPALENLSSGRPEFLKEHGAVLSASWILHFITMGFFLGVAFYLLHTCNALFLAIDSLCTNFFLDLDMEKAYTEWNIVQALLHCTSTSVERCFAMLGTAVILTGLSIASQSAAILEDSDVWDLARVVGPHVLQCICFLHLTYRASIVSYKCSRVPAFINSLDISDLEMRQLLVDYVRNSESGFQVFEVTIDPQMATYCLYFVLVATYFVVTQLVV